ncbi:alpha-galactosidase [Weizmannia acidilactici]|uniref:alpha-galactosidase n=1 Tax=Weizmannia acidilactici TaxID=2607726 RepID=UPI00124F4E16|nr:alpha-galactosidase [Weizmannia acidilactici]GER67838.1 alpha-galactosidase [Weizmannia acidilactici]
MPIFVNEKTQEFHLQNNGISYIFGVISESGQLEHLYFGKKIRHRPSFQHLKERRRHSASTNRIEGSYTTSLEYIKQEYPAYGTTDFRMPAYEIRDKMGSTISDFRYRGYSIRKGKPKLEGLPATYTENIHEAETLEIYLFDDVLGGELILFYTIFNGWDAITRHAVFSNKGGERFYLNAAMSASIDFPDSDFEMVTLAGAWAREMDVQAKPLGRGIQSVYSARGASSHQFNPFLALKRPDATEGSGEVYGFSLVYSGNFLAQVEVDNFHVTRIMIGIHPFQFKWKLNPGETFTTPECVIVYSVRGLNGMSQTYHELYRTRLVRGIWRDKPRPVLFNNWEATYFRFTEEKILTLAMESKKLGIELFVLDDGWFGRRDNDKSSLGDWEPNLEKLPGGIKGLSEKIEALGMKFGLWFEPEMVNKDSNLYRKHPDWVISVPGRPMSHGRNQYVLDFTRDEVVGYVFEAMSRTIRESKISYIKWDMNRNMTEVFSKAWPKSRQGEIFHRYILGVYKLYEKLISHFPNILFESCASGGGRFDPGMLYYAPQTWASDDTDAVERLKIQYGASLVYPLSSIGSHVSAVPNHQTGRITPLETRANAAYFGAFGYELDLTSLTVEEKTAIKKQIAFFKAKRALFRFGRFYRLLSPFPSNEAAWMAVSSDQKEAVVGYYRVLAQPNPPFSRIRLAGLDPGMLYAVDGYGEPVYGDELMQVGLLLDKIETKGDFVSSLYCIRAAEKDG